MINDMMDIFGEKTKDDKPSFMDEFVHDKMMIGSEQNQTSNAEKESLMETKSRNITINGNSIKFIQMDDKISDKSGREIFNKLINHLGAKGVDGNVAITVKYIKDKEGDEDE